MPYGLISEEEERERIKKAKSYLEKTLGTELEIKEEEKSPEKIGEIYYIPLGLEQEEDFKKKVKDVVELHLSYDYRTPAVLLRVNGKEYLLDGHARVISAYNYKLPWKFIVLESKKAVELPFSKDIKKVKDFASFRPNPEFSKFHEL